MVASLSEIDIDALVEEVSPEMPGGEDLEYDPAFIELAQLAKGIPDKQIGDAVIPGQPPNWPLAQKNALALLSRTRDLRIVDILTQASVRCDGLKGLENSLALATSLLEQRWDTLYPQLDSSDNDDATHRINILMGLCDYKGVIQPITRIELVDCPPFGRICLRDIQIATGQLSVVGGEPGESIRDIGEITAAFNKFSTDASSANALKAKSNIVANCLTHLQRIEAAIDDRVGSKKSVQFEPLRQVLQDILKAFSKYAPAFSQDAEANGELSMEIDNGNPAVDRKTIKSPRGPIRSRQDVIRVFDEVCEYYRRCEPSSPVPILITRAKRLVTKDFLDIVKDMVPDGVSQVETFVGGKDEDK